MNVRRIMFRRIGFGSMAEVFQALECERAMRNVRHAQERSQRRRSEPSRHRIGFGARKKAKSGETLR